MPIDRTHHYLVKLPANIPYAAKGKLLMDMEVWLRAQTGLPAEVFMETMRDQNKLRRKLGKDDDL